jgi:hypothetical protein
MNGPSANAPETMTSQFYDAEAVSLASTDWTPATAGKSFARGLFIGSGSGSTTLKVDLAGTSGAGGNTGITLTGVLSGTLLQLAVTKVYKTGTTATDITALY